MVEIKLIAEAVLAVIAAALIIWYIMTNYQTVSTGFFNWIDQIKDMVGIGS